MFLFSTKHAKIIDGFDFIFHFSEISLAIFSSSERITGYPLAGLSLLQPWFKDFLFYLKGGERKYKLLCSLGKYLHMDCVFASLNRIANWSVIERCREPASLTQRIFSSISLNRGKLINWRKARSWPEPFYHFVFHEIALEWVLASKQLLTPRISVSFGFWWVEDCLLAGVVLFFWQYQILFLHSFILSSRHQTFCMPVVY